MFVQRGRKDISVANMADCRKIESCAWRASAVARHFLEAARPAAAVAATLSLSGCGFGILDPQGPIGAAEKTILLNALAIMLAIIVPTIAATLWCAFWF